MKRAKLGRVINYDDKNIILHELYATELKELAMRHRLRKSGTKKILIQRIELFLMSTKKTILIQKTIRAYFARQLFRILLSSSNRRPECVNEIDFYTLEPLKDVPRYLFFVFTDEFNFTYGFNIESLIHLYLNTGKVINPYNRGKILMEVMYKMFTMYGLLRIFFLDQIDSNIHLRLPNNFTFTMMNANGVYLDVNVPTSLIQSSQVSNINSMISYSGPDFYIMQLLPLEQRSARNLLIMTEVLSNIRFGIDTIRRRPLNRRIIEIFMEIDQLGHYTNSAWLFSLSIINLNRFIICLREIWVYRANILDHTKFRIYPFGDPFDSIDRNDILKSCVSIIENFVLSAPDIEDRKLATLFVLSALTRVSPAARYQMSWLYDSFEWD